MSTSEQRPWLASYAENVPQSIGAVDGSLFDIMDRAATEHPDAVALEFFGAETRYRELALEIDRAAEGLRALGVKHGDPVAIVLPNCPQHIAAFYAVLRIGAIVVEHNPLYTPGSCATQFEDHGAKVVIAWDKVVPSIQAFPKDMRPNAIVSVNVTRSMPALMRFGLSLPVPALRAKRAQLTQRVRGGSTWEELLSALPIAATVPRPEADDIAVIQYTSGTTGRPKGAVLSHRNLIANAAQSRAWVPTIQRGEGCVVYAVLPMFHAYGLTLCLTFADEHGRTPRAVSQV